MARGSSAPQARMEAIETLLLWEGRVSRSRLLDFFEVHETQASRDITAYRAEHPDACTAEISTKSYVASPTIRPVLTKGTFSEYQRLIGAGSWDRRASVVTVESTVVDATNVDYWVFSCIHQAIRQGHAVRIEYQSMSTPKPHPRVIRPHAFIQAGPRWHIRAFCEKAGGFRDFNLGRVTSILGQSNHVLPGGDEDAEWNTPVKLRLVPHQDLSADQNRMIRKEYMHGAVALTFDVRAPLAKYLVQTFRAAVDPSAQRAPSHLLMVDRPDTLPACTLWCAD